MPFRKVYDQHMEKSQIKENVFGNILRFKTKPFPVPFSVQIISKVPNSLRKLVVSDGLNTKTVHLSSKYDYLTEMNILKENTIITIFEIKRFPTNKSELFVDNISIEKEKQVGVKIGDPKPINI